MEDFTIRDTAAWKIVRQYLDHVYGSEQKMTDDDFLLIYSNYYKLGGSWRGLLDGDVDNFNILDDVISLMIQSKSFEGMS